MEHILHLIHLRHIGNLAGEVGAKVLYIAGLARIGVRFCVFNVEIREQFLDVICNYALFFNFFVAPVAFSTSTTSSGKSMVLILRAE